MAYGEMRSGCADVQMCNVDMTLVDWLGQDPASWIS